MSVQAIARPTAQPGYRWFVLCFLAAIGTMNFLDRQIVSILGRQISEDLGLSKTQFGLLGGATFALLYTTCGIGVAYLADRVNRTAIIAFACTVWSVFTVLCGTAQSFVQILLFRLGVGFGEAGGSPPSYSLISDYFPPGQRGTALAIYTLGNPIGSMLGIFAGGQIAIAYGWRTAFFAVGAPGVILAVLMFLFVKEPKRGRLDVAEGMTAEPAPAPPLREAVGAFFRDPVLVATALSGGLASFVGYGGLVWHPQFLQEAKGMSDSQIAIFYAIVLGVTGIIGTFSGGWFVDLLSRRDRRWSAWLPAGAFAMSIPLWVGLLWAPSWPLALVFVGGVALLMSMYSAPALALTQNRSAPAQRTISGAIMLLIMNLMGMGTGPLFVGWIADTFADKGDLSLVYGYAALVPFIGLTVVAYLFTANLIHRTAAPKAA